jgi:hypothetical protein
VPESLCHTPLNPLVPTHLKAVRSSLKGLMSSAKAGSPTWFLADAAHRSVGRALAELNTAGIALERLREEHQREACV